MHPGWCFELRQRSLQKSRLLTVALNQINRSACFFLQQESHDRAGKAAAGTNIQPTAAPTA